MSRGSLDIYHVVWCCMFQERKVFGLKRRRYNLGSVICIGSIPPALGSSPRSRNPGWPLITLLLFFPPPVFSINSLMATGPSTWLIAIALVALWPGTGACNALVRLCVCGFRSCCGFSWCLASLFILYSFFFPRGHVIQKRMKTRYIF